MKIFIGSSLESKDRAEKIADILSEIDDVEAIPWWREDVFSSGSTYIESLHKLKDEIDAAVMIFSDDDKVFKREKEYDCVRDNILIEYGLFSGVLGRRNVAAVIVGEPNIPSDLWGMQNIELLPGVNLHDFKQKNSSFIKNWHSNIEPSVRQNFELVRTEKEVLTYVFNRLNPYQDITLTRRFLSGLPSGTVLQGISDVINPLDRLIHHYAKQLIKPYMRVYFAHKLVGESLDIENNHHYRIGISISDNDETWRAGLKFGVPSNVDRVYKLKAVCRVRNANNQIDSDTEQNYAVGDEGSVVACPVLYSDDSNAGECIGVLGISSPNEEEVSDPKYELLINEISVLFSSLFYAYGKSLGGDGSFESVVEKIQNEIDGYFTALFD